MPDLLTNSLSILEVNFRLAAAPISSNGDLATSIISTALLIALYSAIGRRLALGVNK